MVEIGERTARPTVLLVATLDTKHREAGFLISQIRSHDCEALVMDTGVFAAPTEVLADLTVSVTHDSVAEAAGSSVNELCNCGDKGRCIRTMTVGAQLVATRLYAERRFHGIIGIGGAQGTDIGTKVMQVLPFGLPKLMLSAVATGSAQFGPFVGTKDIAMMHSVADLQGLNFVTTRMLSNAAAAICGMVDESLRPAGYHRGNRKRAALSMSGTTTPGALLAMARLESEGFEVVAFHQNGTGGIAMEDMIGEDRFDGVLDINLHEVGDAVVAGLHAAVKGYRLETAGRMGIPQVLAPGSINYTVQGPYSSLSQEMRQRKLIVHNSYLTLVRLSHEELRTAARAVAQRLNRAKGTVHFFVPLRGYSDPDREGFDHWDPEGNRTFVETLRHELSPRIPITEIDAHINDEEFIFPLVKDFVALVRKNQRQRKEH